MTLSFLLYKKFFLKLMLVLWLIFSSGYIAWNIWSGFRFNLINQAYQQGVADAVNQLIGEAENTDCKPVHIFNKEQKKDIQLVNMNCLTKPE